MLVVIWKKDQPIKIRIYGIKTFNKEYEWESEKKYFSSDNNGNYWDLLLNKLDNNEYLLKNLIIKIENNN